MLSNSWGKLDILRFWTPRASQKASYLDFSEYSLVTFLLDHVSFTCVLHMGSDHFSHTDKVILQDVGGYLVGMKCLYSDGIFVK